ncbi:ABC transporter permease [Ruegeria sp. Ofav3-42]|uniref:ABC transporter permease n=1 Tax=Ruegeria sp. Ofav3-42 TaxID=2917759 RepID=UPI001EF4F301|nr:ABC transporter permease [Ruegeria sp. Ofav3-42]MCG7522547.1 ABC transporter permease [Ruegeria sp. Ofav3-42]
MTDLFQQAVLVSMFAATIRIAAPLLLVSIGELVVQRAGIWFLGVEGSMLMAAFVAYFSAVSSDSLYVGLLAGMATGVVVHLSMAIAAVTLKINQFVTGLGINLLASGLTLFLYRENLRAYDSGHIPTVTPFETVPITGLSQLPILGEILFDQHLFTYFAFAMVGVVWAFLYRTRFGLEIRALGENPKALDTKGLSVSRRQYSALAFGGLMAGLAGSVLVLALTDRFVPGMTGGRGWLAIVIIIAGNWKPLPVLAAVLVFAFLEAFQIQAQGVGVQIPYQLLLALPYIGAIIVMMGVKVRSEQPAHLGVPYHRE